MRKIACVIWYRKGVPKRFKILKIFRKVTVIRYNLFFFSQAKFFSNFWRANKIKLILFYFVIQLKMRFRFSEKRSLRYRIRKGMFIRYKGKNGLNLITLLAVQRIRIDRYFWWNRCSLYVLSPEVRTRTLEFFLRYLLNFFWYETGKTFH